MDLVLGRVNPTGPVALTGSTSLPVALDLLEVQMGQVFDAGVEGSADVTVVVFWDSFCKHRWSVGAREGGWGGEVRNSHDGGYFGDVVDVPRWFQTGRLRLVGHINSYVQEVEADLGSSAECCWSDAERWFKVQGHDVLQEAEIRRIVWTRRSSR